MNFASSVEVGSYLKRNERNFGTNELSQNLRPGYMCQTVELFYNIISDEKDYAEAVC
jgi:hypothetical protein